MSDPAPDDLVAFLRARLDDDEQLADRMDHDNPDEGGFYACPATRDGPYGDLPGGEENCDCGLANRRGRLLREVESKRLLLAFALVMSAPVATPVGYPQAARNIKLEVELAEEKAADMIMRLLALPYSDHPDYRQEWKP